MGFFAFFSFATNDSFLKSLIRMRWRAPVPEHFVEGLTRAYMHR